MTAAAASLAALLLNGAPHGEVLGLDRLFWIGTSVFIYALAIALCFGIPAHLLLKLLGLHQLVFYGLAAGIISCIGYGLLYRYVEGGIWLRGMLQPLIWHFFVGLLLAPLFRQQINRS
jgi:hypothetical protein